MRFTQLTFPSCPDCINMINGKCEFSMECTIEYAIDKKGHILMSGIPSCWKEEQNEDY